MDYKIEKAVEPELVEQDEQIYIKKIYAVDPDGIKYLRRTEPISLVNLVAERDELNAQIADIEKLNVITEEK